MNTPPITLDFTSIDTSFRLIAAGHYDFRVEKAEVKPTKAGGKMLSLELVTTDPAPNFHKPTEMLAPGVRIFHNQMLTLSGKMTQEQLVEGPSGLAALLQSCGIAGNFNSIPAVEAGVKAFEGTRPRASVKHVPGGTDPATGKSFREKNEISFWVTKK